MHSARVHAWNVTDTLGPGLVKAIGLLSTKVPFLVLASAGCQSVCMPRRAVPGVFCFEGRWSSNLADRSSVRPLLDLLQNQRVANYAYFDVATVEELCFYLRKWHQAQYRSFRIGYFAFRGDAGQIIIGRHKLTLTELGDTLEDQCEGKIIYFGSCQTLPRATQGAHGSRRRKGDHDGRNTTQCRLVPGPDVPS